MISLLIKFTKKLSENYSGYRNTVSSTYYPKNIDDIKKLLNFCRNSGQKLITVGSKLSRYDTILNSKNIIIDLKKLKKKIYFNKK